MQYIRLPTDKIQYFTIRHKNIQSYNIYVRKRFVLLFIAIFVAFDILHSNAEEITQPKVVSLGEERTEQINPTVEVLIQFMSEEEKESLVRSVLSENDEILLAKMLWGEDRENPMYMRAAIIWCVFNRLDNSGVSIQSLVTTEQFAGYLPGNPVKEWAVDLIRDVTIRYVLEKNGFEDVGRVLPSRFIYYGQLDGKRYHVFKTKLSLTDPDNERWDWSLPSPY